MNDDAHIIYARHDGVQPRDRLKIPLIKRCIRAALLIEGVNMPCEVSVLITNDERIREINNEYRGIDKATDVLSFPMQEFYAPGWPSRSFAEIGREAGRIPLGDIVLSADRVKIQAREHSQTCEQETAYLTIHSVLHLLGYDHVDEAVEKRRMRDREKIILGSALYERLITEYGSP